MPDPITVNEFCKWWEKIQSEHAAAMEAKGFWDDPTPNIGLMALIHEEVSEASRTLRNNDPRSDHIDFLAVEEELADVVLRVMDYAEHNGLDIPGAILAKMKYNLTREYLHGKLF